MDEKLLELAKRTNELGYRIYKSFFNDEELMIVGSENKCVMINRSNFAETDIDKLRKSLKEIFDSMKPNSSFSKTNI